MIPRISFARMVAQLAAEASVSVPSSKILRYPQSWFRAYSTAPPSLPFEPRRIFESFVEVVDALAVNNCGTAEPALIANRCGVTRWATKQQCEGWHPAWVGSIDHDIVRVVMGGTIRDRIVTVP
jgi:hypothetical protein